MIFPGFAKKVVSTTYNFFLSRKMMKMYMRLYSTDQANCFKHFCNHSTTYKINLLRYLFLMHTGILLFPSNTNSRCCCKRMAPTAGQNLDYFYPHFIQEISRVVLKKILLYSICPWHLKCPWYSIGLHDCCSCVYFMGYGLDMNAWVTVRVLVKQLSWFPI